MSVARVKNATRSSGAMIVAGANENRDEAGCSRGAAAGTNFEPFHHWPSRRFCALQVTVSIPLAGAGPSVTVTWTDVGGA